MIITIYEYDETNTFPRILKAQEIKSIKLSGFKLIITNHNYTTQTIDINTDTMIEVL